MNRCSRLSFWAILGLFAFSVTGAGQARPEVLLRNADIVSMVKLMLPPEAIVRAIETHRTNFSKSSDSLIGLKDEGVPDTVLAALLKSDGSVSVAGDTTVAFILSGNEAQAEVSKASASRTGPRLVIREHAYKIIVSTPIGEIANFARTSQVEHPGSNLALGPSYLKQVVRISAGGADGPIQVRDIMVKDSSQKVDLQHTFITPSDRTGVRQAEFPLEELKQRLQQWRSEFLVSIVGPNNQIVSVKVKAGDLYGLQ